MEISSFVCAQQTLNRCSYFNLDQCWHLVACDYLHLYMKCSPKYNHDVSTKKFQSWIFYWSALCCFCFCASFGWRWPWTPPVSLSIKCLLDSYHEMIKNVSTKGIWRVKCKLTTYWVWARKGRTQKAGKSTARCAEEKDSEKSATFTLKANIKHHQTHTEWDTLISVAPQEASIFRKSTKCKLIYYRKWSRGAGVHPNGRHQRV